MQTDAHNQRRKCRRMILVSIKYKVVRIFAGVPWRGGSNDNGVLENNNFEPFR